MIAFVDSGTGNEHYDNEFYEAMARRAEELHLLMIKLQDLAELDQMRWGWYIPQKIELKRSVVPCRIARKVRSALPRRHTLHRLEKL